MSITVYGASDDLIEVRGDIDTERYAIDDGAYLLSCSDGTVLSIEFDDQGIWRIRRLVEGQGTYTLTEAKNDDDNSDEARLDAEITWIVFGRFIERKTARQ